MRDVTVVVPTHDRDGLLATAIASVLGQDLAPAAVVVSDDRGSAATRTVVEAAASGSTVPVTYLDASGPTAGTGGASRNAGARLARSTWLAFLDDDDTWRPDFLSACLARADHDGADLVVAWVASDDPDERVARMPRGLAPAAAVATNPGFIGSNVLYRTAAFEAVGGFDPELLVSEDKDLLVRLLRAGHRYGVVEDFPVLRRSHGGGQLTSTRTARRRASVVRYMDKHADLLSWRNRPYFRAQLASIDRVVAPGPVARATSTAALVAWRGLDRVVRSL